MTLARRRQLLGWCALAPLAGGGCAPTLPPVHVPMERLDAEARCSAAAPTLVVMLPGVYSRPREFFDEGFVTAARRRGVIADIVVADAHLGYYNDRSVLTRLREDIVLPARAGGVRHVWLVGISLGGFGALGYGARHGSEIDGIVALAPYLGRPSVLKEIADDGGALAWQRRRHAHEGADDLEREVWEWVSAPPEGAVPVYLGYGRDDRFAAAHRQLAQVLPKERVFDTPGGHDWGPWRALWIAWLGRGLLPTDCTAA